MSTLLARPPEEAVRILALTQLAKAEEAAKRLSDPDDEEALHDFRVSLRRLRSIVRAYPEALTGSLTKSHRKRLRALAKATGSGRDAEVALGWIEGQRDELAQGRRQGVDWLAGRLAERKEAGYERVHRKLEDEFAPLADELQRRLGVYTREVRIDEGVADSFGDRVAASLRNELAQLEELLIGIVSIDDVDRCHRARLAVKRVRYLIEPLSREVPAAEGAVESLKRLQDLLGEINDSHVLEAKLSRAVEKAARQRSRSLFAAAVGKPAPGEGGRADGGDGRADGGGWGPVDGVLAVARRNRERRDELFAELAAGWTGAAGGDPSRGAQRRELVRELGELAREMTSRREPAGSPPAAPGPPEEDVSRSPTAAGAGTEGGPEIATAPEDGSNGGEGNGEETTEGEGKGEGEGGGGRERPGGW